ncbi:hypothetical protein SCA6_008181 [Theobroma cacao]
MASATTYYFDDLQHVVYQPRLEPVPCYPTPRFVQAELTISFRADRRRYCCSTDHFIDLTDQGPFFSSETLRFCVHVLRDHHQAYQVLAPVLRRLLGIINFSITLDPIIDDIIRHGLKISNWRSNMGREVLILRAELWGTVVEHVEHKQEAVLRGRALEESASGFGKGGEHIKTKHVKIIKRRVKSEDCVVCLEALNVGSRVSRMPCSHIFHSDCIGKWLKQSHNCPVCRFHIQTE